MRSLLALTLVLCAASPASAQDAADVARARQLFQSGLEEARGQRWDAARDAFAESLALAERPSTLLNLAGAQVQTGQLVEGAASYRRFLELATDGRDAAHRSEAESALHAAEARIAHVTIEIEGLDDADEVRLDDAQLTRSALGTSLALNPGAHDARVLRDGRAIATQRFQLAEGQSTELGLTVATVSAPVDVAPVDASPPMDQAIAMPVAEPPPSDESGVWIAVGVSVGVAIAIGVVVAVLVATQDQSVAPPYMGNLGAGVVRF